MTAASPLYPLSSQKRLIIWYLPWLERGVKERGGSAPSHIFSPVKQEIMEFKAEICSRGGKGVSEHAFT